MAYMSIVLTDSVPACIQLLVRERIEPILRDVRLMLEFPKTSEEPGFNLTAVASLFGLIAGLSRVFHSTIERDGDAFRITTRHYPLTEEPHGAVRDPDRFAHLLYKVYRCNLVHSLGFATMWRDDLSRREIVEVPREPKVTRHTQLPLGEARIAELDIPVGRPGWLLPTLEDDGSITHLNLEALYWGVRRLVLMLSENEKLSPAAQQFLDPWYNKWPRTLASGARVVTSSEPQILSFQPGGQDATSSLDISAVLGSLAKKPDAP